MPDFSLFQNKMSVTGMSEPVIKAFRRNYESFLRNETGMIPESAICPARDVLSLESLPKTDDTDHSLLARTVVIKLNGGLGTGMGLQGPKSLLTVAGGLTFLDLIVRQTLELRRRSENPVRLLLMNSFSTSDDTLSYLAKYRSEGLADPSEIELMQNRVPKIDARTLAPVSWPADSELEWCPPGHGDLYPALVSSGWLDRLLSEGIRYAFVSNSDNLGAVLDPMILAHFAASDAPFLMEVTRRTPSDSKGGHLAVRKSDGRLLLREVAQCPEEDLGSFQDIGLHRYFNTNNLWIRLDLMKSALEKNDGSLPLPMIRNKKTVDPRDKGSTPVIQLETAMGAAIECFEGAAAIEVPRSRFAPVKTTADLLALRSDAYDIRDDGQVMLAAVRNGIPPNISLSDDYKLVDGLDRLETPSLIECHSLAITGPVRLEPGVVIRGDVVIENPGSAEFTVKAGMYSDVTIRPTSQGN
jgi:UTP--glucose-1-phosphate uridylyltransferase